MSPNLILILKAPTLLGSSTNRNPGQQLGRVSELAIGRCLVQGVTGFLLRNLGVQVLTSATILTRIQHGYSSTEFPRYDSF